MSDPNLAAEALNQRLRRHLLITTVLVVGSLVGYMGWANAQPNSSLVVLVFLAGTLGGLFNNFRRFKLLRSNDPTLLSSKYVAHQVYLSPIIAGVFGVILYLTFLTGIIQGDFFPSFSNLEEGYQSVFEMFNNTAPTQNKDAAKAVFWAFLAGFSEGLVPNMLDKVSRAKKDEA